MSRAALTIKRNDKETAPGKEYRGLKHGDPVEIISDADEGWKGKSLDKIITSQRMYEAFGIIEIDPIVVPKWREFIDPVGDVSDKVGYRPRMKRLNIDRLAQKCGIPDINNRLHSGDVLDTINGTELIESDFDDATLLDNSFHYPDIRAVSSGDHAVGAAQIYTTATAFFADIANLTGNLSGTVKAVFTASAAAEATETLGGFEFKFTSDTPSLGNYSTGHLITITYNGSTLNLSFEGAGTVIIENQRCIRTVAGAAANRGFVRTFSVTTGFTLYCRNNMYNGNSLTGGFFRTTDSDVLCYVYNNIGWDISNQMFLTSAGFMHASSIFASNTCLDAGVSGVVGGGEDATYENDAILDSVTSDYDGIAAATGNNTAASDASNENGDWNAGANNLSSLTAADEFESLLAGDGDNFCLPKTTGNLYQGGLNPTIPGHTTYINSVTIETDDVDIGAKGVVRTGDGQLIGDAGMDGLGSYQFDNKMNGGFNA